jgi:uncharacterized protein YjbI with pentapeptide repeats
MYDGMLSSGVLNSGVLNSGVLLTGVNFIGVDFICAALTLAYIAKLMFNSVGLSNAVMASCSVAKVSLQGQQVARRLR